MAKKQATTTTTPAQTPTPETKVKKVKEQSVWGAMLAAKGYKKCTICPREFVNLDAHMAKHASGVISPTGLRTDKENSLTSPDGTVHVGPKAAKNVPETKAKK